MPRNVNGVNSAYRAAKVICRMVSRFGVLPMSSRLSPEFAAAALALTQACMALDALDDYVDQIDRTPGGTGSFDEDIAKGLAGGSAFIEKQNVI